MNIITILIMKFFHILQVDFYTMLQNFTCVIALQFYFVNDVSWLNENSNETNFRMPLLNRIFVLRAKYEHIISFVSGDEYIYPSRKE